MGHRPVSALLWLVFCAMLVACGRPEAVPDDQATVVAARSLATLNAKALPTATAQGSLPSAPLPTQESAAGPTAIETSADSGAPVPTATPAATEGTTATPGQTPTRTGTAAATVTASATASPTASVTGTATGTATATRTPSPTTTPTATRTPLPTSRGLAFASNRDGNVEIYAMKDDGSGITRLTNDAAEDARPAWSPDGARIAFESTRGDLSPGTCGANCLYHIYVMNADGSGVARLTEAATNDLFPAWSPDGSRIAFASGRDGNWEIYAMNAGGGGLSRLTDNPAEDFSPAWSPDGERIAFSSTRDEANPASCDPNCNHELYVVNADGGGLVRLTNNPAHDWDPAWSPR